MKICNFEKLSEVSDIVKVVDYVAKEKPYVIVVPVIDKIAGLELALSEAVFRDEVEKCEEVMAAMKCCITEIADELLSDIGCNCGMKSCIHSRFAALKNIVGDNSDLLADKMIRGEMSLLSCDLLKYALRQRYICAQSIDMSEYVRIDYERMPDVDYLREQASRIAGSGGVDTFVVPSLLCVNCFGETDFIKKSRSDFYAVLMGVAFGCGELHLFVGAENIYSCKNVYGRMHDITYSEAAQLINCGVNIVSMECISLAGRFLLALKFFDSDNWDEERFLISSCDTGYDVKAVVVRPNVSFVRFTSHSELPGYLLFEKLFETINKYRLNIVSMATSNVSVSMLVSAGRQVLTRVGGDLRKYLSMTVSENMAAVNVVGSVNMKTSGLERRLMRLVDDVPVSFFSYGDNDHCFTMSVPAVETQRLLSKMGLIETDECKMLNNFRMAVPDGKKLAAV